jgi:hypothetical protein
VLLIEYRSLFSLCVDGSFPLIALDVKLLRLTEFRLVIAASFMLIASVLIKWQT